jgi:hypothetical protein
MDVKLIRHRLDYAGHCILLYKDFNVIGLPRPKITAVDFHCGIREVSQSAPRRRLQTSARAIYDRLKWQNAAAPKF